MTVIRRRRKKCKRRRLLAAVCVALLVLAALNFYAQRYVDAMIYDSTQSKIRSLLNKSATSAAAAVFASDARYSELLIISYDSEGKIASLQTNTVKINRLAREVAENALSSIESAGQGGVQIPLGSMSGIPILAGRGSDITVKVAPVGLVECRFYSTFDTAGVNQTRHRLTLEVVASAAVIVPRRTSAVSSVVEIAISETVIVGEVPDIYLGTGTIEGLLPLVP